MTTSGHLEVDPAEIERAVDLLQQAAGSLRTHAPDLRRQPDAGASSGEVATALAVLAEAVSGMAEHLASVAESTRASVADVTGTDQSVGGALTQRRGALGP